VNGGAGSPRSPARAAWPSFVLAAAAVAWPLFHRGGFDSEAKDVFVVLAGSAAIAAIAAAGDVVLAMFRTMPIRCLAALAGLTVVSASWSLVEPEESFRWGLVICGYLAMSLTGGVLCARLGARWVAAILLAAAVVSGLFGLGAVALRTPPEADWLDGAWRPGGPLEYPNTLALLQVCALIPLAHFALSRHRVVAASAAVGLGVASAVLSLAGSPAALGLAIAAMFAAVAAPRAVLGATRSDALAICLGIALAALAAYLIAGGSTQRSATGGELGRLLALGAVVVATPLAIALARRLAVKLLAPTRWRRPALVALALALGVWVAASLGGGSLHGRDDLARAGIETSLDRPLLGAGAGGFGIASIPHQTTSTTRTVFAHNLPIEVWAELGILGLALTLALYAGSALLVRATVGARDAALVAPCVVAFLISNLIDWSWHQPAITAIWALCLGALLEIASSTGSYAET